MVPPGHDCCRCLRGAALCHWFHKFVLPVSLSLKAFLTYCVGPPLSAWRNPLSGTVSFHYYSLVSLLCSTQLVVTVSFLAALLPPR